MATRLTVVISRGRSSPASRQKLEEDLLGALQDWPGLEVVVTAHLYDLSPDGPAIRRLRSASGDMVVVSSLYPRAAFWVLGANGVSGRMGPTPFFPVEELEPAAEQTAQPADGLPGRTIWCVDLRDHDRLEPLLDEIDRLAARSTAEPVVALPHGEPAAAETLLEEAPGYRWYPVVDYSRCGNCLECLNFCLFGVFALDESGQLIVEQPDACRDGCPACSRVCPSHAIIFPHHNSPAIAGDPEASAEGFNLDLVQLLGTAGAAQLAVAERDRALSEQPEGTQRPTGPRAEDDDLDRLVDELDELDL